MLFLAFLLFAFTRAQDICSGSVATVAASTGRPKLSQPQKVLYVNILPGYDADMLMGYTKLVETLTTYKANYGASTAEFYSLTPSAPALSVSTLEKYTQIWVADLGPQDDNSVTQMASYRAISQWYINKGYPHLICDGRWISELWGANAFRPSQKLVENYFANLAVRGGGLLLATDHAEAFTRGINEINKGIGIGPFTGYFYDPPYLLEVDQDSPLMTFPNDPTHHNTATTKYIYDDSSTSFTPYNIQPNGQILYPIGWHGAKGDTNPGLSTTIRGSHGFLIDITSPTCGARITGTTKVAFTAKVAKGGTAPLTWKWINSVGTVLSTEPSFTWIAPAGHHLIKVTATDSQKLVAEATVSFRVIYDSVSDNDGLGPSGDGSCYIFLRDGKEVTEVFPITRTSTPAQYYGFKGGEATTTDGIQQKNNKAANFFLYTDGQTLAFETILSKVVATSAITVKLNGRFSGPNTTVVIRDDALDNITWSPTTETGSAQFRWKDTTKGFVIDGLPLLKGPQNNWCFDVTLDAVENLDFFSEYSHILPSKLVPNPNPVDGSYYYIASIPSFSYCKTTCYSPPIVTLTQLQNSVGPLSVDWTAKTGGLAYNDNTPTTWLIKPASTNITGIGVHFVGPYAVAAKDALDIFAGDNYAASATPVLSVTTGGTTAPASVKLAAPSGVFRWVPNNDRKNDRGWSIWYAVIPTVTGLYPINGPVQSHSWVTISGSNFVNTGKNVIKFGGVAISGDNIKFDSPNAIRVNVPPPTSGTGSSVTVQVSNDGVFFESLTQKYTFFQGTCKDVTSCADCFNLGSCAWCSDLTIPTNSFCYSTNGTGGRTCPLDQTHNADNDCTDAPDFKVSVMEGESIYIRLIKPELKGKVTQVKITGTFNGTLQNMTSGGIVVPSTKTGQVLYSSYLYLNGKTNVDTFTYELTGAGGYSDKGVVTVNVSPLSREYLDGLHALEIADECKNGTHNCQQLCVDGTPIGGYICGCRPGYTLVRNRFCDDIDECATTSHGCVNGCTNLPGTYSCNCRPGYAKNAAGVCELQPCPLTDWVVAEDDDILEPTTMEEELPKFMAAVTAIMPLYDTSAVPGHECAACFDQTTSHRTINQTAWNGSQNCAADRTALVNVDTCKYPCVGDDVLDPLHAVSYTMAELTHGEWMEEAMRQILGNNATLFFFRPAATDDVDPFTLPYFYVTVANCNGNMLSQTASALSGVIADILPEFAARDKISVEVVGSDEAYCAVKVTFDTLIESLKDCADALWDAKEIDPTQI